MKRLQLMYEDGSTPVRTIAAKWNISTRTLRNYISKYKWSREALREALKEAIIGEAVENGVALSEKNRKQLVEAGGNELYEATATYYKVVRIIQESSLRNLTAHDNVMKEEVDYAGCEDTEAKLKMEDLFTTNQHKKLKKLLISQTFIQSLSKSTTEGLLGTRKGFGLDKSTTNTFNGDVNLNVLIADGLRKGRERIGKITEFEDMVMKPEKVN